MTEAKARKTAEEENRRQEPQSVAEWVEPRLFDSQTEAGDQISGEDTDQSTFAEQIDGMSQQALKDYSRSILYSIVLSNNSPNENRLLREIYWHIIEILAHPE